MRIWGFPKIRGTLFKGSHHKDYSILGVDIGVPLFWESTIWVGLGIPLQLFSACGFGV